MFQNRSSGFIFAQLILKQKQLAKNGVTGVSYLLMNKIVHHWYYLSSTEAMTGHLRHLQVLMEFQAISP